MRAGLWFDLRNPAAWRRPWPEVYARALERVAAAEELGADGAWFSEHHLFDDGYLPQPLTFASAAAARTSRIRLGTAILIAGLRPAAQVTEDAVLVDIISNGRLELGIGAGYRIPEFDLFGADARQPVSLARDRIREIQRLWQVVTPEPVQAEAPIWGGFFGPRGARTAGELGIGLLAGGQRIAALYRKGLIAGGHPASRARIRYGLDMLISADPERDWPRVRDHVAHQHNSYRRYRVEGTGQPVPDPIPADELITDRPGGRGPRFRLFTPEQAIDYITSWTAGLPVEEVFCWADIAGLSNDLVEQNITLWCSEVAPALRKLEDAGP